MKITKTTIKLLTQWATRDEILYAINSCNNENEVIEYVTGLKNQQELINETNRLS